MQFATNLPICQLRNVFTFGGGGGGGKKRLKGESLILFTFHLSNSLSFMGHFLKLFNPLSFSLRSLPGRLIQAGIPKEAISSKYKLRSYEFSENSYIKICYYMLRYTAYQLMVETVLRLQFRCDENNTKFQQHENLSLKSSHTNMKTT